MAGIAALIRNEGRQPENGQQASNQLFGVLGARLDDSSALKDSDHYNDDSDNQQEVDEPTHGVGGHKAQDPQYQQYTQNCPKHG